MCFSWTIECNYSIAFIELQKFSLILLFNSFHWHGFFVIQLANNTIDSIIFFNCFETISHVKEYKIQNERNVAMWIIMTRIPPFLECSGEAEVKQTKEENFNYFVLDFCFSIYIFSLTSFP